jgi:pilus assembly protein Flp/PilA
MRNIFSAICVFAECVRNAVLNEEGQDLIEYALVAALIASAAVAGMNNLATTINTAFASLTTTINSAA